MRLGSFVSSAGRDRQSGRPSAQALRMPSAGSATMGLMKVEEIAQAGKAVCPRTRIFATATLRCRKANPSPLSKIKICRPLSRSRSAIVQPAGPLPIMQTSPAIAVVKSRFRKILDWHCATPTEASNSSYTRHHLRARNAVPECRSRLHRRSMNSTTDQLALPFSTTRIAEYSGVTLPSLSQGSMTSAFPSSPFG